MLERIKFLTRFFRAVAEDMELPDENKTGCNKIEESEKIKNDEAGDNNNE